MMSARLVAVSLLPFVFGQRPDPRLLDDIARWRQERRLGGENFGRHASVHWTYVSPYDTSEPLDAWYNQVKVSASSDTSYFSVMGNSFGYAGIQQVNSDPFTGKVIFSIWDPDGCSSDDQNSCPEEERALITQCGPDVTCTRFGGEGSGAKTYFDWHGWQVDETYQFLLKAKPIGPNKVEYTCWFHAESHGEAFEWRIIASIVVKIGSHNWWIKGMYSFVEQWSPGNLTDERTAAFGPALVRRHGDSLDSWRQVVSASWSHSNHPSESKEHINGDITPSGDHWELTIGGDVDREISPGNLRSVDVLDSCPQFLVDAVVLETAGTLQSAPPPSTSVSCGGHSADTCANCVYNKEGAYMGSAWCNGECSWSWSANACQDARRLSVDQIMCSSPPTAPPVPTHQPTPLPSTCFPGESVVNVAGKKNVAMADLRSNDLVLVERLQGGLAYEPILGFLHATGYGQESGYLTVVHSIGEVRVSSNHVLFVKSGAGRRDTLASDLKVGDQIYVVDDAGGSLVASSVLSVRRGSTRLGMFAPFTSSGTIVVDDVLASNYGSVPVHSAAHAAMFLARVASSFGLGGSFFQRFASTLGNSAEFNPLVALLLHPYLKLDQLLVKP